jgi:hypothetical protein
MIKRIEPKSVEGRRVCMFEHRDPTGSNFMTYELDANDFELYQDDTIAPGGEIGTDIRSGSPIYLPCWGKVATIYYNPMNHSFLVMISRLQTTRYATSDSEFKDPVIV